MAGSLLLSRDAIQDIRLSGHKIKYGTVLGNYALSVVVGNKTSHTIQNLTDGLRHYVVTVGRESNRVKGAASAEISGWVLSASAISASSMETDSVVVSWQTNKPGDNQVG